MNKEDAMDALLDLGIRRGSLYFEELEDVFPADYFPLEEMEHFLTRLDTLGIRVAERKESSKIRVRQRRRAA